MILASTRRNFINKLRKANSLSDSNFDFENIREIGVLADLDILENTDSLEKLPAALGLPQAKLNILGYIHKKTENREYPVHVFCRKDVNNYGKITGASLSEFVGRKYDILINYYAEDKYPLKLASAYCKTSLKVGFATIDKDSNDLILNCDIQNSQLFTQLLKTYLKVIKKG